MSGSVGWCAARRRRKEAEIKVEETGARCRGEGGIRARRPRRACRRTCTPIWVGGSAARRDERHRRLGGPAAQRRVQAGTTEETGSGSGNRVRDRVGVCRGQGWRVRRAPAAAEKVERSARANRMFQLHGRRSPRDGRLAPAVRRHAGARAPSECGRPLRRGHRRWPRGSCLAAGAAKRRAAPNQHLVVDSCGGCSPAARHGLGIRHELASDAASGRIGRR